MEANYCTQYENVVYVPTPDVSDNVGAPFSIDLTTIVFEVELFKEF